MKKIILILLLLVISSQLLVISSQLFATEDDYPFSIPAEQQRFQALTSELRCLVCQNENLAESNAVLAIDLRRQIYKQMQLGQSNQAIVRYLVERYGDYILYRPPFNFATLFLWLTPFLLLFLGIAYLIYYLRKL